MGYVMGYGLSEAWMTKTLQTVLGHSSAKVTLDVYAELWPDRQKDQTRRWRRLRPRSRADATSTWRNDDDGSQETNGPHDPEGHRRTGRKGRLDVPSVRIRRRRIDAGRPPARTACPLPPQGVRMHPTLAAGPRSGGGVDYWQSMSKRGASKTASLWGDGAIAWRTGSGFTTSRGCLREKGGGVAR